MRKNTQVKKEEKKSLYEKINEKIDNVLNKNKKQIDSELSGLLEQVENDIQNSLNEFEDGISQFRLTFVVKPIEKIILKFKKQIQEKDKQNKLLGLFEKLDLVIAKSENQTEKELPQLLKTIEATIAEYKTKDLENDLSELFKEIEITAVNFQNKKKQPQPYQASKTMNIGSTSVPTTISTTTTIGSGAELQRETLYLKLTAYSELGKKIRNIDANKTREINKKVQRYYDQILQAADKSALDFDPPQENIKHIYKQGNITLETNDAGTLNATVRTIPQTLTLLNYDSNSKQGLADSTLQNQKALLNPFEIRVRQEEESKNADDSEEKSENSVSASKSEEKISELDKKRIELEQKRILDVRKNLPKNVQAASNDIEKILNDKNLLQQEQFDLEAAISAVISGVKESSEVTHNYTPRKTAKFVDSFRAGEALKEENAVALSRITSATSEPVGRPSSTTAANVLITTASNKKETAPSGNQHKVGSSVNSQQMFKQPKKQIDIDEDKLPPPRGCFCGLFKKG